MCSSDESQYPNVVTARVYRASRARKRGYDRGGMKLSAVISLVLLAAAVAIAALVVAATYGGHVEDRGEAPAALSLHR